VWRRIRVEAAQAVAPPPHPATLSAAVALALQGSQGSRPAEAAMIRALTVRVLAARPLPPPAGDPTLLLPPGGPVNYTARLVGLALQVTNTQGFWVVLPVSTLEAGCLSALSSTTAPFQPLPGAPGLPPLLTTPPGAPAGTWFLVVPPHATRTGWAAGDADAACGPNIVAVSDSPFLMDGNFGQRATLLASFTVHGAPLP
jgi:hypothetical protein